jgi:hypothetical protein
MTYAFAIVSRYFSKKILLDLPAGRQGMPFFFKTFHWMPPSEGKF